MDESIKNLISIKLALKIDELKNKLETVESNKDNVEKELSEQKSHIEWLSSQIEEKREIIKEFDTFRLSLMNDKPTATEIKNIINDVSDTLSTLLNQHDNSLKIAKDQCDKLDKMNEEIDYLNNAINGIKKLQKTQKLKLKFNFKI